MCNLLVEVSSSTSIVLNSTLVIRSSFFFKRPSQEALEAAFFKPPWTLLPPFKQQRNLITAAQKYIINHMIFGDLDPKTGRVVLMMSWVDDILVSDIRYHQFGLNHPLAYSISLLLKALTHHWPPFPTPINVNSNTISALILAFAMCKSAKALSIVFCSSK